MMSLSLGHLIDWHLDKLLMLEQPALLRLLQPLLFMLWVLVPLVPLLQIIL